MMSLPYSEGMFIGFSQLTTIGLSKEESSLLFNIVEMFYCCWFQTLAEATLRTFLPDSVRILCSDGHLNLGNPLYQGNAEMSSIIWRALGP